ncbi:MAG: sulfotransferase, partial [Sneathiellales bacterium]|nr:sulfotransferase [Sneathiellales bacterium]
ANDLHRTSYNYSVEDDLALMRGMKEVVTKEFLDKNAVQSKAKPNPIFIFGMPRSGTSLVEQILASHSKIHGAGELYFFEQVVYHDIKKGKSVLPHVALSEFQAESFPPLATHYMDKLRKLSAKMPFITDKMPRNFLYVGLIRLLFPNAILVHCTRQPEDSCLSIYKKYFVGKQYFAYNLEELAHYYNGYLDLMQYWNALLPGEILEISYEDMVADVETHSRRLIEHCGLDWEEACLHFHKTKRAVNTASTAQVRQPIYSSSVQAWKKYEKELEPLTSILNQ